MKFSARGRALAALVSLATISSGVTAVAVAGITAAAQAVVTNTSVNLRTGPGTGYSIIRLLPAGTALTATGTSGSWTAVSYSGGSGYVWSAYITPVATPAPIQTGTSGTAVTTTDVNVRTGPGTGYSIVTHLNEGVTVPTTGATSGSWTQIVWGGAARWVYSAYIRDTTAAPVSSTSPTPTRTPSLASPSSTPLLVAAASTSTPTPTVTPSTSSGNGTPTSTPTPSTSSATSTPTPTATRSTSMATPTPSTSSGSTTPTSTPTPTVTPSTSSGTSTPTPTVSPSTTMGTPTPSTSSGNGTPISTPTPTPSTSSPTSTPTSTPAPVPEVATSAPVGQLRTTADVVLRIAGTADAASYGVLPADSIVDITGLTTAAYTQIIYGGNLLWIDTLYTAQVIQSPSILSALGYPRSDASAGITEFGGLLGSDYTLKSGGSFGGQWSAVKASDTSSFARQYEVVYPAGSASQTVLDSGTGTDGGAQSYWRLASGAVDEAYLRYYVYFPAGFNFVKGGKLPGLYGGTHTSGGDIPDGTNGLSTRYMWRAGGAGEVYAYLPSSISHGTSLGRGSWTFPTGTWTCMTQHVKLNNPGQADGSVDVSVNGTPVFKQGALVYRTVPTLKIDGLFFSTFFGGGDATWATPTDQYARFGGFAVSTNPLAC